MKVIMNPPYSGSLHLKILNEVLKHFDDVVCLHPATWLSKHSLYKFRDFKDNRTGLSDVEIIEHNEMNKLFSTGNSINKGVITVWKKDGNVNIDRVAFSSDTEFSLYKKVLQPRKGKLIWRNNVNVVANPTLPYFIKLYVWHSGNTAAEACLGNIGEKGQWNAQFKTEEELNNFIQSFHTKFIEWCYQNLGKAAESQLHMSMFVMDDYSHPWTDQDLYSYFQLSDEEIKIIEATVK